MLLSPSPPLPFSSSQHQHWKTSHRDGSSSIKSLPVKCCLLSCVDTVNISIATSFPSSSIVQHLRLVTEKSLHFIASSFHSHKHPVATLHLRSQSHATSGIPHSTLYILYYSIILPFSSSFYQFNLNIQPCTTTLKTHWHVLSALRSSTPPPSNLTSSSASTPSARPASNQ